MFDLPTSWETPSQTRCMTPQNFETGFNGNFTYVPEKTFYDQYGYE
jgi:hypothetical protein